MSEILKVIAEIREVIKKIPPGTPTEKLPGLEIKDQDKSGMAPG